MNKIKISSAIILQLLIVSGAQAETKDGWELAFFLGTSFSKNETLTIKQEGYPDIILEDTTFATNPLNAPPYYSIRLGKWRESHAWEIEHIHQKIYIEDLPADVQHFEITDGYNLFLVNSAWQLPQWGLIARAGAGVVIAHPQITVRGQTNYTKGGGAIPTIWDTDSGYQWTGPAIQLSLEKEIPIYKQWLFSLEGKLTHANADIDIEGGSVNVPNTAIHVLFGLKYNFE